MRLYEEYQTAFAHVRSMYLWVLEAEHIFDGSWASSPEEISNATVGQKLARYLERLFHYVEAEERTADEQLRLGHLWKILTHLRPGVVQCYDVAGFPRTNNDMERMIRAVKMHYRRISGRKNWSTYLLRYGRCVAYQEWWHQQDEGEIRLQARLCHVAPASWQRVRQETRQCHQEQLHRYRFRHHPLEYLASLEKRWEQTVGT
ncbi:MAG TPA: hypothetical protein VFV38_33430 [Ktedonobacteraceae bacterium]|nr:hypothetical protein [Ktedonobacteraceae bacterium]